MEVRYIGNTVMFYNYKLENFSEKFSFCIFYDYFIKSFYSTLRSMGLDIRNTAIFKGGTDLNTIQNSSFLVIFLNVLDQELQFNYNVGGGTTSGELPSFTTANLKQIEKVQF